ncbi:MAG: hypothetical protein AAF501_07280 [Pseudomonadota bacterium]
MTPSDIRRLKDLARRVKEVQVARFAEERRRAAALLAELSGVTGEIGAARQSMSHSDDPVLLTVGDRWTQSAERRLASLAQILEAQRAVEDTARTEAAKAAGREEAIGLIEREIARLRRHAARRRAEQEGQGTSI